MVSGDGEGHLPGRGEGRMQKHRVHVRGLDQLGELHFEVGEGVSLNDAVWNEVGGPAILFEHEKLKSGNQSLSLYEANFLK